MGTKTVRIGGAPGRGQGSLPKSKTHAKSHRREKESASLPTISAFGRAPEDKTGVWGSPGTSPPSEQGTHLCPKAILQPPNPQSMHELIGPL